jgi:hypothetical protein
MVVAGVEGFSDVPGFLVDMIGIQMVHLQTHTVQSLLVLGILGNV